MNEQPAYNEELAFKMVKARMDRLPDEQLPNEEYIRQRIQAAACDLKKWGIRLTDGADDLMTLCDLTVWNHHNRDQKEGMPEWLKQKRRDRWLYDLGQRADGRL